MLLHCWSQEDGLTSPRSEEGYGRAGPGLLLWQAPSRQCECCPSASASLGRAGCSRSLGLAPQMMLLDLQYQCRVGLLFHSKWAAVHVQFCLPCSWLWGRWCRGGWGLVLAGRVLNGAALKTVQTAALACEEVSPCLQEPINLSLVLDGVWGAVSSVCKRFSKWLGKVLLKEESVTSQAMRSWHLG